MFWFSHLIYFRCASSSCNKNVSFTGQLPSSNGAWPALSRIMCAAFERPHNSKRVTWEWIDGVTVFSMRQLSITCFSEEPCSSNKGLMPPSEHWQDSFSCSLTNDAFCYGASHQPLVSTSESCSGIPQQLAASGPNHSQGIKTERASTQASAIKNEGSRSRGNKATVPHSRNKGWKWSFKSSAKCSMWLHWLKIVKWLFSCVCYL